MSLQQGAPGDGQAEPRVRHAPEATYSNAWEDVADLAESFGISLDDWQLDVLRAALGERKDGSWAVRQVGVSAPRQNGKTLLIVARVLAGLLLFGERTIIVSAHRQDTARQVFDHLDQLIQDNPSLYSRIFPDGFVGRSGMREYIRTNAGQMVQFKARANNTGRGFSSDCLLLDEAQILSSDAWSTILPTMSARPNAQAWLLGTPPSSENDDGHVFGRLRQTGVENGTRRVAYLEWSAERDDDLDDTGTWAKANPAYGMRITREAVESERASMSDEQFRMERLGMWDADGASQWVIPAQFWNEARDLQSAPVERLALGVEAGPNLEWASVALAGQRKDGLWHVELDERQEGASWVPPLVRSLLDANPQIRAVVADAGSPSKALFDEFARQKVRVTKPKVNELGAACAQLLNGIVSGMVKHTGQGQMDFAIAAAGKRTVGDTAMWVWNRKTAASDITPVQAATLALMGAQNENVEKPRRAGSGNGKVVVMS